jgi:2-hydroxychromene-2-carboxylate isomerase
MLGAAFKASGLPPLVTVPLKGEYSKRDFDRSARFLGVPYRFPPKFPAITLAAARGYYWLHGQDCAKAREFARAVFRAYWVAGRDIGESAVVLDIAAELGIDRDAFTAAIATAEIKERVKQETEAAIAKGMFGAPYFMVDGEPFWGADRLPQIDKWLETGGF